MKSVMKIMTFNTQHCKNFLTGEIDFEVMAKAILDCDPDVVGLNEMRGKGTDPEYEEQVEKLANLTGMKYYRFCPAFIFPDGPYGNGIMSKIPFEKVESIPIPDPDPKGYDGYYETRGIIKAVLEGGVTVMVIHAGLNPDEHINAIATLCDNIEDKKCVLMGDFNMIPSNPILDPLRERMVDTARAVGCEKLSFRSDNPYCKIDYIFVSPDVEIVSADIPAIVASDHLPHIAELKI